MLKRVIEDYLESIEEIQFFLPFASLLRLKGYYDVHIIHGTTEFGKDIIAKKYKDNAPIQYFFQLKAGDINLSKYRSEIQPQLLEAVINNLSHPNFDQNATKNVYFVTTGIIKPPATIAFQDFNRLIETKYSFAPILSIEKTELVEDFENYGIEPFFALHNDPTFVGEFFEFYSKIKNNKVCDSFCIEKYTRRWIYTDINNKINRLQVFFEAYLFSALLLKSKQYYQAVLFIAALARFLAKCKLYSKHNKILLEYLDKIIGSLIIDVKAIYNQGDTLASHAASSGLLAIFRYPKLCLHTLELLSLYNLLLSNANTNLNTLIVDIIQKERGWERPLSDNFAMSVAFIGLSLIKNNEDQLLKKIINNITIFLCDRYSNIGLADLGASEDEEFEQLLSEYLDGLKHQNTRASFLASILLDLAYLTNDQAFYESIANDLLASSIITERYHVLRNEDIYEYKRIASSNDSEYSRKLC